MRPSLFVPPLCLIILACSGGGAGPSQSGSTPTGTCPIPVAKAAPSFANDLVPAIQSSCGSAASSCHGPTTPAGHITYAGTAAEVHARLVNATPANAPAGWVLIKPGVPSQSWLLEKVTKDQPGGSGYGTRMPQGAPNLCQPTVDTLTAWVNAGAPNN